jgi:hypothetical protein
MIARESARAAIALLSEVVAELTGNWAGVEIAGDDDLVEAAVAARLVASALADAAVLANAVQVLARWAEEAT